MKVLDVNEFYAERGGGVRTYVHRKLAAAADLGVEVVVVAPGERDGEEVRPGGKIVWVKSPKLPLDPRYHVLLRERAVHAVIDAEAPDVIEGSSTFSAGWMAARYPGPTPRVLVFHQDPVAVYPQTLLDRFVPRERIDRGCEPYWRYLRHLASRFDRTVVSGEWLAERLRAFDVPRPAAVAFGIDKERFRESRRSAAKRAELLLRCGIDAHGKLLVGVSRHHPEKRLGTLLAAVAKLEESRDGGPRVGLVLYGDGPLRAYVDAKVRGIPGVYVAGFTSDPDEIPTALASADAFLHGSAAETYGLVVAEAICSGLPIVVPDVGGAADLAEPGYAETYRAGDAAACAAAIRALLARDRTRVDEALEDARVRKVADIRDHFRRLFELYDSLRRERRAAA